MRRIAPPLVLLSAVLLAGCSSDPDPSSGSADGSTGTSVQTPAPSEAELTVQITPGPDEPAVLATVSCTPQPAGDLPDVAAVCDHLAGLEDPFAPLAEDVMCTEQYGGPQTARVTGEWDGEPVDPELSRTDGCAIAQWDALGPLLPVPVG